MLVVVNMTKPRGARLGIDLSTREGGKVTITDMIDFPQVETRGLLQIGDVVVSANGAKTTSAASTAKLIIASGPHLSLLISRVPALVDIPYSK